MYSTVDMSVTLLFELHISISCSEFPGLHGGAALEDGRAGNDVCLRDGMIVDRDLIQLVSTGFIEQPSSGTLTLILASPCLQYPGMAAFWAAVGSAVPLPVTTICAHSA